jgi:hypothetical protein
MPLLFTLLLVNEMSKHDATGHKECVIANSLLKKPHQSSDTRSDLPQPFYGKNLVRADEPPRRIPAADNEIVSCHEAHTKFKV